VFQLLILAGWVESCLVSGFHWESDHFLSAAGIVTSRDTDFLKDRSLTLSAVMTTKLVVATGDMSLEEATKILLVC